MLLTRSSRIFAHFSSLAVQYRTTRGAGVAFRRSLTTQNCRYDYAFPLTPYPLLLADNLACSSYLGDGHYVAFIDEIAFIGPIFRHLFTHQLRLLRFFVAFSPKRSSRVFPRSSILGIASKNVPFFFCYTSHIAALISRFSAFIRPLPPRLFTALCVSVQLARLIAPLQSTISHSVVYTDITLNPVAYTWTFGFLCSLHVSGS